MAGGGTFSMTQIGNYPLTGTVVVAEDDDLHNLIFKIELDAALEFDLIVKLDFAGTGVNPTNYATDAQVPDPPSGVTIDPPTPTSVTVVIPAGKVFIELPVIQAIAEPRPTVINSVAVTIADLDTYRTISPTATGYISPRGANTYSTVVNGSSCPVPNIGYSLVNSVSTTTNYVTYGYSTPNSPSGGFFTTINDAYSEGYFINTSTTYLSPLLNGVAYTDPSTGRTVYYGIARMPNTITSVVQARAYFNGFVESITTNSTTTTFCEYIEI